MKPTVIWGRRLRRYSRLPQQQRSKENALERALREILDGIKNLRVEPLLDCVEPRVKARESNHCIGDTCYKAIITLSCSSSPEKEMERQKSVIRQIYAFLILC